MQSPARNMPAAEVGLLVWAGAFAGNDRIAILNNEDGNICDFGADDIPAGKLLARADGDPTIAAMRQDRPVAHVH